MRSVVAIFLCWLAGVQPVVAQSSEVTMNNSALRLSWKNGANGWQLQQIGVKNKQGWQSLPQASGEYTLLYSETKPADNQPLTLYDKAGQPIEFPERKYKYNIPVWEAALSPVPMNTAGTALYFYPAAVTKQPDGALVFTRENNTAALSASWKLDEKYPGDICVTMELRAKLTGYYSLATPTLATMSEQDLQWAAIPGYFQSNYIEKDLIKSYAYMQGIPDKPVIVRERTASTLAPFINTRQQLTLAVIPAPGTARDPWEKDKHSNSSWQLGLSLMNRKALLTPTAYHPVLGEKGSYLQKGETVSFSFRYSLQPADWYTVYKHAVNDIYRFPDFLALKQTKQSLTSRILHMHHYLVDDSTSFWKTASYKGMEIGAQAYLGGVYGSDKDAFKNSDYGAMWMLANITQDSVLQRTRLPYARNFKLMQQEQRPGFFHGAAAGQYYLAKSRQFTEEWGPYVEPIGTTYYMTMDIGNVLLFNPHDTTLKQALREAADRLLAWMEPAGKWEVAYDHATEKKLFTEVEDLRPTFYGLLIAYKMLGDQKYLAAAKKGADWYITNAIEKGCFLGVCGDVRFVADFATGQSAGALLDLYEVTKDKKYLQAAIQTAKLYTTSIYTQPIPTTEKKTVNGRVREDWEISQVGLSFEHGGIMGSANHGGPILLASHAGMFVRMFGLTKDSLFLNMARAAAFGRDAFVDSATSVASYYWATMNKGAGPYPHHAWWQVGWITDYLLAEIQLRSSGNVSFPHGFITPKVGPHETYGFAPGKVYGTPADLLLREDMLQCASPYLDYYCAINRKERKLFLLLLNNGHQPMKETLHLDYSKVLNGETLQPKTAAYVQAGGKRQATGTAPDFRLDMAPYGLTVIEIQYEP
ncbi:glycerophosphoryl diester phosphodiesterase [Chitinophaga qingshengii]|uniref:Glycerophosphoryl diester phosphodiesterase n=1 Tax=Chitinophaga qingshengii TaxID=1569794 RepID=A0ABR7TNH7_9BACT|nr:glycerophosphoryl diester phosphodiesterase [Chitinophaga qingshengii]MBC9932032.1 glycerophosphoryl diester phosphodiesterase [Chitinophaga qingshengii]